MFDETVNIDMSGVWSHFSISIYLFCFLCIDEELPLVYTWTNTILVLELCT
jgi:hypothetical protein